MMCCLQFANSSRPAMAACLSFCPFINPIPKSWSCSTICCCWIMVQVFSLAQWRKQPLTLPEMVLFVQMMSQSQTISCRCPTPTFPIFPRPPPLPYLLWALISQQLSKTARKPRNKQESSKQQKYLHLIVVAALNHMLAFLSVASFICSFTESIRWHGETLPCIGFRSFSLLALPLWPGLFSSTSLGASTATSTSSPEP